MTLVTNRTLLDAAARGGYGVGAFNVADLAMATAVLDAARATASPVIVETLAGSHPYGDDRLWWSLLHEAVAAYPDVRNDYFAAVSRALQERLANVSPTLLSADSDDDLHTEESILTAFRRLDVDGLVIFPTGAPGLVEFAQSVPTVVVDRTVPSVRGLVDHVLPDARHAAEQLTLHMIEQHHVQRVCLVAGDLAVSTLRNRHTAFQRVVSRTGTENHVLAGLTTSEEAATAAYSLFRTLEPPFGVLATNSLMFWGVLTAAQRLGLKVPSDVVLTTFDNVPGVGTTGLVPTNAVAPAATLAARTVQLLTERMNNPALPPRLLDMDYDIAYGTTCGCVPIDPARNVLG